LPHRDPVGDLRHVTTVLRVSSANTSQRGSS
jgi:hypothetical protein